MKRDELPRHEIPALAGNNAPIADELDIDRLEVEGELPADFNGLYVRNVLVARVRKHQHIVEICDDKVIKCCAKHLVHECQKRAGRIG